MQDGAKRIILGLGGSATNDGGCGCAAALGVRFLDGAGDAYIPVGGTLDRLCGRLTYLDEHRRWKGVGIVAMCDVDNPLCGPSGRQCCLRGSERAQDRTWWPKLD
ncbi:MAG: glycerate kinase [Oscillospiraceae bacterium]